MIREVMRGENRWYETDIGLVPSVSTICQVAKSDMGWWEAKKAAEYAMEHIEDLMEQVGSKAMVIEIAEAAVRYRDGKGEIGTALHEYVDAWCQSRAVLKVPTTIKGHVEQWHKFVERYQFRPILAERLVWSPHGYAGRLDLVGAVTIDDQEQILLIDTKTGKSVYGTVALQLAAYRYAQTEEGTPIDNGDINGCAVLHLRPKSYRLVPVQAGPEELRDFRYCREVFLIAQRLNERISPPCN